SLQQLLDLREYFIKGHGLPSEPLYSFAHRRTTRRPSPYRVMLRTAVADSWSVSGHLYTAHQHTPRAITPLQVPQRLNADPVTFSPCLAATTSVVKRAISGPERPQPFSWTAR